MHGIFNNNNEGLKMHGDFAVGVILEYCNSQFLFWLRASIHFPTFCYERLDRTIPRNNKPVHFIFQYGWYWGPISGEAAEKVLSAEPDGSFIVRDSSDQHYIFSLSFRLNGNVRHVRIEHDQGNINITVYFSFYIFVSVIR